MGPIQNLTILWKLRTLVRHPVLSMRVFLDRETPLVSKILPVIAAVYVMSPLDFLPDIFPILGLFDDASIIILFVSYALSRIPDEVFKRAGLDATKAKIDYKNELPMQ